VTEISKCKFIASRFIARTVYKVFQAFTNDTYRVEKSQKFKLTNKFTLSCIDEIICESSVDEVHTALRIVSFGCSVFAIVKVKTIN